MPILRYATVTAVSLGLLVGAPAVALAEPVTGVAAPTSLAPVTAPLTPAAPAQSVKSKKRCSWYVKTRSGKKVKRWGACKSKTYTKTRPAPRAKAAPKPSQPQWRPQSNCHQINGISGGTRPGHRNALDYMASGSQGQAIADTALAQMRSGQCGVVYVIWRQTYYGPGAPGGKRMEDRGSPTQNHFDHVHVEY